MQEPIFRVVTQSSLPMAAGDTTIQLNSSALQVRLPFWQYSGFIWNRPASITLRPGTDDEKVVPIVDGTRLAQIAIFGSCLATALLLLVFTPRTAKKAKAHSSSK